MADAKTIVVFGSGSVEPNDSLYAVAYEFGKTIGQAGWQVCTGGYGGIMEAVSRGVAEQGGHTIGVSCRAFSGRAGVNAFVKEELACETLFDRLQTLMDQADIYVFLDGGTGTLLELAAVLEFANKKLFSRNKLIICFGDHWISVVDVVKRVQPETPQPIVAKDVAEIVDVIKSHNR